MHKRLVTNIILRILLLVCLFMTVALAWSVYDGTHEQETTAFMITIFLGLVVSCFFRLIFRVKLEEYKKLNAKDGLAIVGLSWICLSAFGALPLYLSQVVPTYTDALFEIISGFTTTGATVFVDIEALPRGILFWRSLTHWLGGMGIIVLYLALLPALGQNASQLYKAESPGITIERIEPSIKETAKILWTVYFLFTFLETVLLMIGGMTFFDALCHTFGTIATGGFSTQNTSIGGYSAYIQWVIITFMFFAGTNFILHYQALKGNIQAFFQSEEFRCYFFLIIVLVPIFALVLVKGTATDSPFRDAAFQVVAMLTTTGYTTVNFDAWPHVLRLGLVLLMFIGGCGGSTGGGMKVVRIFLSIKIALRSILRAIFPNAVLPVKFNTIPLPGRLIMGVLSYFVIFMLLFFLGAILFTMTESCDLVTAFSASIAALSNIGPGLGKVGATQNYAWVSMPGKWLLSFLMLAGRLELYSILILFLPTTWKK